MNLSPYPKYRPSEVEWLRDVPEHWDVARLGQIGEFSKGNGGNKGDETSSGVPCIRYGDIYTTHQYFISRSRSFVSATRAERYMSIRFGDVLFAASGETIDEIGKSAVNLMRTNACCGGDIILFRPEHEVEARYMGYALDCRLVSAQKSTMGRGITVMHIYKNQLKYLTFPLPPYSEQVSIATFLDHETAKINTLIARKQTLIERLTEKRSALISRTMTSGIPPNPASRTDFDSDPEFRPSGINWCGSVPRHWNILRLKYIASINDETLSEATDPSFEISYVDIGSVDPIRGIISSEEHVFENSPSRARRIVRHGDTIVSTVRTYLRAITFVKKPMKNTVVSTGFAVVRPHEVSPEFLAYAIGEMRFVEAIMARSIGVSYPAVNASEIATLSVLFPSQSEQNLIVKFLNRETSRIDVLISKIEFAIERLEEYGTALVDAAVTGAIDVRAINSPIVNREISDCRRVKLRSQNITSGTTATDSSTNLDQ